MPRRVFFSHSTEDGTPERAALQTLAAELAADGYEILLDRSALQAGQDWRPVINAWISDCHAAVILVTPGSIKSKFCTYEWDILSFRRRFQKQFPIFPVFLGGSKPNDIKGRPDQIYEIGGYFGFAGVQDFIPNLKQRLQAEIDESNATRWQVAFIAEALSEVVKDTLIDTAAHNNGIDLGTFDLNASKPQRFARKLMELGLVGSLGALQHVRSSFKDKSKADAFHTIAELVGRCSWVNVDSAQRLRVCARSEAACMPLGLDAGDQRTAEAYILTASDRHPRDSWPFGILPPTFQTETDFHQCARVALVAALGFEEVTSNNDELNKQIKSRLKIKRKAKLPVFVVLQGAGLQRAWIEGLQKNELFAGVTFLILTGPTGTPGLLADDAVLKSVLPPGCENENEFWSEYDTVIESELNLDSA